LKALKRGANYHRASGAAKVRSSLVNDPQPADQQFGFMRLPELTGTRPCGCRGCAANSQW